MLDINLEKKNRFYIIYLIIFFLISFVFFSFYCSIKDKYIENIYKEITYFGENIAGESFFGEEYKVYKLDLNKELGSSLSQVESGILKEKNLTLLSDRERKIGYTFVNRTGYFYYAENRNGILNFVLKESRILIELSSSFLLYYFIIIGVILFLISFFYFYIERSYDRPIKEIENRLKDLSFKKNRNIYIRGSSFNSLLNEINRFKDYSFSTITRLELVEQNQRYILNSMSDGVIAIDKEEKIIHYNKKSCEYLGLANIRIGNYFYNIIRNNDLFLMINGYDSKNNFEEKELKYLINDEEKILKININNLLDSNSEVMGLIIIISDITNIKRLENIRSEFASNVSHELKTPLTSILGFIDTIFDGAIEDKTTTIRFLEIIRQESNRLKRLIEDILLISKLEQKQEGVKEQVNISELANYVIEVMNSRAKNKKIELLSNIPDNIQFFCNKDGVLQILFNLVSNGIKYTNVGFVKVIIVDDKDKIIISVVDSGIGILEKDLDRIFERFYTVDKSRKGAESTGLGLAIVKHLVILYKGEITINSKINEGSNFIITLPKEIN